MPISIGIGKDTRNCNYRFTFGPDVYYWILETQISQLQLTTGRYIDLYDCIRFLPDEFIHLDKFVEGSLALAIEKPVSWDQYLGVGLRRMKTKSGDEMVEYEIYESATRMELEALLTRFADVLSEAKSKNTGMIFLGD